MVDFAALEDRVNFTCIAHLANCSATLDGGEAFGAIFNGQYVEQFGMGGSSPALECLSSDVAAAAHGSAVVVTYKTVVTSYTVAAVKPDGTGTTMLLLQEA